MNNYDKKQSYQILMTLGELTKFLFVKCLFVKRLCRLYLDPKPEHVFSIRGTKWTREKGGTDRTGS
jgi:hypothetical protein